MRINNNSKSKNLVFPFRKLLYESTFEDLKVLYEDYEDLQNEILMLQPLKNKRSHSDGWLKKLVRIIVNLNRWVHTRFAFS